jgi:pimeloyl-ACP methyl ester carboxylesterase
VSTWVLLRGLMRESRHWGEFPLQFQNAMDAKHVVPLDFPGNGSLHALKSLSSVEEMVDYARSHLKQLGYAPPYNLLGLSLGAMVAVAWSERYPEELEKMVLINTSLAPYNPFYLRLRPKNYTALTRLLYGSAAQHESLILSLTSTRSRTENMQAILEQWIAYATECPIKRSNILRQLKAALIFRAAPTRPSVHTLLLAGQQDQLVNVKCSLGLAQHWGCAIKLHPTAGHDLPLDDGVWVIQQVKEGLSSYLT